MFTLVLRAASAAASIEVSGGASTTSTSSNVLIIELHSRTYAIASREVLNIFQLAASRGVLIGKLYFWLLASGFWLRASRQRSALTPGNSRPPRNSNDAPPPVEMCVIFSATPARA